MNHDDLIEISRQEISAYFHGRALEKNNERLTAENAKLQAEVKDLFTRNQTLVSENDKLQAKAQNQRDENAKLQKLMRANEKRAIDAKVELNEDVRKERAHASKLQAENAKLRAELAEEKRIIKYIDKKFPRADETCDEPGITLSEAVRRTLAEQSK